jgi:hypothetical protein
VPRLHSGLIGYGPQPVTSNATTTTPGNNSNSRKTLFSPWTDHPIFFCSGFYLSTITFFSAFHSRIYTHRHTLTPLKVDNSPVVFTYSAITIDQIDWNIFCRHLSSPPIATTLWLTRCMHDLIRSITDQNSVARLTWILLVTSIHRFINVKYHLQHC